MIWFDMRCDVVGVMWNDVVWYDVIWFDAVECDVMPCFGGDLIECPDAPWGLRV